MTPYDQLSWGNDDGTSCDARCGGLLISLVAGSEKEDYWRIAEASGKFELIEEGYGKEALKKAFNAMFQAQPQIVADEPTGFDWRNVSNAELKGDRRNEAYKEKLRRSVEAVQEYNAGRELSEQYGISSSLLRQLTGVKPERVSDWIVNHQSELDSYREAQGHGYHQNKGKVVRDDIKWSEAAYGAYEW